MHVILILERPRQENEMFEGSLCSHFGLSFISKIHHRKRKWKSTTSTDIYSPARARYSQRHFGVLWMEQEAPILCSLPLSCLVKSVKDWYHGSREPKTSACSLTFPPIKLWSNVLFTEMWNALLTVPECTLQKKTLVPWVPCNSVSDELYWLAFCFLIWRVYKSHDTNKLVGLDHQSLHTSWPQLLFDSFLFHPWYSSSESQHESRKNGWFGSYTYVPISIIHNVDKENVMYYIV